MGGRCRTFPTAKMHEHMIRVLVYLGRTADLSLNYCSNAVNAYRLVGRSDSSWEVRRSTTGYVIKLAGASVAHGSRRQHCIAMSSTEAEMMAVADLALELLYVRDVLGRLGHVFSENDVEVGTRRPEAHRLIHAVGEIFHGPTEVGVDNSGAYNLCQRVTTGKNSRHVERKTYKMRELHQLGIVRLSLVPTDDMEADLFTKPLPARVEQRRPSAAPGGGGGGGGASLDQGLRRPSIPANANGGGRQLRSQSIRRISQESSSCAAREGAPPRVPITSSRNSEEEWKEEVSGTMRRCSTDLTQLHERLGNLEKALSSIARCTGAGAVATADQGASTPSRVSTGSKPGNRPAIGNREESPPPDLSERLKQWVGIGGSSGGAPADLSA